MNSEGCDGRHDSEVRRGGAAESLSKSVGGRDSKALMEMMRVMMEERQRRETEMAEEQRLWEEERRRREVEYNEERQRQEEASRRT